MLPTFLIDRSLGEKIIFSHLIHLGLNTKKLTDHFPQDTPDPEWLSKAGEKGWAVLTADTKIKIRPNERMAIINGKVKYFALRSRKQNSDVFKEIINKHLNSIIALALHMPPPFTATITKGHVGFKWLGEI